MTRIWNASYFLTALFTFSDPLQVLKFLLMSIRVESGVLDERDSAGVPQDSFKCMHTVLQQFYNSFNHLFSNCMP